MDARPDVYLFGQVLGAHSFLLKNGFLPGGETDTMLYDLEAERDVVAAVAITPFQTEEYHGVNWQAALKDEEVATVHLLAVNPRYQKRGYAKAIMKEVINNEIGIFTEISCRAGMRF